MRKRRKNNFIKDLFIRYINENSRLYILLFIIFFIGLSIGIICINNTKQESQQQIASYINDFTNTLKSEEKININKISIESIKNNIIIVLILCFLGSTVIGTPLIYLLVMYKGYSFGYTVAAIFATLGMMKGIMFSAILLLPYLIYIPTIITISISSVNMYKKIISNRRERLSIYFGKHVMLCLGLLILMCAASIIENYMITWAQPIIIKHI